MGLTNWILTLHQYRERGNEVSKTDQFGTITCETAVFELKIVEFGPHYLLLRTNFSIFKPFFLDRAAINQNESVQLDNSSRKENPTKAQHLANVIAKDINNSKNIHTTRVKPNAAFDSESKMDNKIGWTYLIFVKQRSGHYFTLFL